MDDGSPLPEGGWVELPGRGGTWVWDTGEPSSQARGAGVPPEAPSRSASAPPAVLLHGWTSTAALTWSSCFAPLGALTRVIALDHRGHGRGIRSNEPFSLEACADDVAALVEHLSIPPVVAVGYSMGGPIAQLLWRRHPEVVAGLVLCATAMNFTRDLVPAGALQLAGAGLSRALAAVPASLREESVRRLTLARNQHTSGWALAELQRGDPLTFVQAATALATFDSSDWVARLDRPTAVVVTTGDRTVPVERQRALAQALPAASVWEIDADHRAVVAASASFVPALLDAYRSVAGPRR